MPIVNGLGTTTNNNGHSLDDKSNVQVDFVWGNFPMQPNDDRYDNPTNSGNTFPSTLLDPTVSVHNTAVGAYNGYPSYDIGAKDSYGFYQGTRGADTSTTVDYIKVPSVLGKTTALAIDALEDAGFVKLFADITRVNATSTSSANIYASNADVNYPLNSKITIVAGTPAASSPVKVPTYVLGEWTVTGNGTGYVTITSSAAFTAADTTGINSTGTIKSGLKGEVNTITTATAVTATKAFTAGTRTVSTTALTLPITAHGFVSGQVVDVRLGTADADVDGQWTVAAATTTDSLVVTTTGKTTAKTGLAGTVKLAVTAVARTAGTTLATLTVGNAHGFVAGQQVVVAGIDADVNGTWVVDATSTANSLVVITTGKTTVKALTGQTGTVVGLAGTVLSQSVAANAASIAPGTAITITPWA